MILGISNLRRKAFFLRSMIGIVILHLNLVPMAFSVETISSSAVPNAYRTWNDLAVSGLLYDERPVQLEGAINGKEMNGEMDSQTIVTYGGEKEGSSSKLTRIMGPSDKLFEKMIVSLPVEGQELFLRDFLLQIKNGKYLQKKDKNNSKLIPKETELSKLNSLELQKLFRTWLDATSGKPFSFLTSAVRKKFYHRQLPGLGTMPDSVEYKNFKEWVPHLGEAEKYISAASTHHGGGKGGWEINFKKQNSYGEFEKSVEWFKNIMGDISGAYQAPGHMWMVFPLKDLPPEQQTLAMDKMAEVLRNIQAYIALMGIKGNTGIEFGDFKNVMRDDELKRLKTTRGVLRIERDTYARQEGTYKYRFGKNTLAVELRSGTKDPHVQKFVQKILTARLGTFDFSQMENLSSWSLVPKNDLHSRAFFFNRGNSGLEDISMYADKYDVSFEKMKKFFTILQKLKDEKMRPLALEYLVPLWNWQEAPYLQEKSSLIKELTGDFINFVAHKPDIDLEDVRKAMRRWIFATNILADIENYLKPKAAFTESDEFSHQFVMPANKKDKIKVDVNKIDLGIEYSTRFPHKYSGAFSEKFEDGKKQWLETFISYTPVEREQQIKKLAETLSGKLNGTKTPVPPVKLANSSHGHGLAIAFEVLDPKGRKWRLEWDGVGRSYDRDGKIIEGSGRSGHVELVTPKFLPTSNEIKAVFDAFNENNMIPSRVAGGGHINVDLAPFAGHPKKFARFLSLFHQYRGMMAMLFQHIKRLKSAEPTDISSKLTAILKNFNGDETSLKQTLYNQRYFNQRVGRKSRYQQIDISSYYQDVIPERLIHADYDINNPSVLWRPQFRVEPPIRKMEFRMMDAPQTPFESALQIKLVRALLHKAFNNKDSLSGKVQSVDHAAYAQNPQKAFDDLKLMTADLGLNFEDYKGRLAEALEETRDYLSKSYAQSLEERLLPHPKVGDVWGQAVDPRPAQKEIGSEGRSWEEHGKMTVDQAEKVRLLRIIGAEKAQVKRQEMQGGESEECFARRLENTPLLQRWSLEMSELLQGKEVAAGVEDLVKVAQGLIENNNQTLSAGGKRAQLMAAVREVVELIQWNKAGEEIFAQKVKALYQLALNTYKFSGSIEKKDMRELYLKAVPFLPFLQVNPPFPMDEEKPKEEDEEMVILPAAS